MLYVNLYTNTFAFLEACTTSIFDALLADVGVLAQLTVFALSQA